MRDAQWWGASAEGVPLWLLTLAFALLSLWLWRRGRRREKGSGFELVTAAADAGRRKAGQAESY